MRRDLPSMERVVAAGIPSQGECPGASPHRIVGLRSSKPLYGVDAMLYKYRSIKKFKYFVDIILNSRLYAAPYFNMNDPMEGHYIYSSGEPSKELIRAIKGEKEKIRICSLSRTPENALMWAHFADGHHGVVVGIEVDRGKYDVRRIQYVGLSSIQQARINPHIETAKRILCHKHEVWSYEKEERIFVTGGQNFANVEVKELILGCRMSKQDNSLLRNLVTKLAPNVNVKNSNVNQLV
jgi:hypothetical protein